MTTPALLDGAIHAKAGRGAARLNRSLYDEVAEELLLSLHDKLVRDQHRQHVLSTLERRKAKSLREHQATMREIAGLEREAGAEILFTEEEIDLLRVLAELNGWRHSDPELFKKAHATIAEMIAVRQSSPAMRAAERVAAEVG